MPFFILSLIFNNQNKHCIRSRGKSRCNFLTKRQAHASCLYNDWRASCLREDVISKWQAQDISYARTRKCLVEKEAIFYFRRLYLLPLETAACRCAIQKSGGVRDFKK